MSILRVAQLGHPVLRAEAAPVSLAEIGSAELNRLIQDMIDTMRDYGGVGIAAPQVRVSKRLFIIEVRSADRYDNAERYPLTVVLNPTLSFPTDEQHSDWEGCLSAEGLRGLVPRYRHAHLEGLDETGAPLRRELKGFPAIVAQHEMDHLNGMVYLDHMKDMTSLMFLDELRRYHRTTGDETPS
ncbi:MAG: peptide deformylase [Actinomycetota bacterium]